MKNVIFKKSDRLIKCLTNFQKLADLYARKSRLYLDVFHLFIGHAQQGHNTSASLRLLKLELRIFRNTGMYVGVNTYVLHNNSYIGERIEIDVEAFARIPTKAVTNYRDLEYSHKKKKV